MSVRGTRAPRCLPSSQIQKPSEATRISDGDRGDERDGKAKNRRRREKIVIYRTIRMSTRAAKAPAALGAHVGQPAPTAPSEASYEARNESEECMSNTMVGRSREVIITKRHKRHDSPIFASHFRDRVDLNKKVPLLGVRLKSTRRSHTKRFCNTSFCAQKAQNLDAGCPPTIRLAALWCQAGMVAGMPLFAHAGREMTPPPLLVPLEPTEFYGRGGCRPVVQGLVQG